jgi:alkylhydroperoxidase/carboxymuconolactone decarboxylase family protein YurZ
MSQPPEFYVKTSEEYPELVRSFEALGRAAKEAGPLDAKAAALVRLGLGIGAGLEGSAHSSVRKALAAGCTPAEVRHAAILCVTTLGFPSMMRARAWVEDVLVKYEENQ